MSDIRKNLLAFLLSTTILALFFYLDWIKPWMLWLLLAGNAIFVFLQRAEYRRNLIVISILGFLTGWRGLDFSPSFIVYPTELFFWLALVVSIIEKQQRSQTMHLGFLEASLFFFSLQGIVVARIYQREWLNLLAIFKSFIVFIPMLLVLRRWLQDIAQILLYVRVIVYIGMLIAISGLLERFYPSVVSFLPVLPQTITRYNYEFRTAIELSGYNLWGTPVVSVFLVLCAGLAAFLPSSLNRVGRYIDYLAFPVIALGIVASGYRSAWLGLAVILVLLLFLHPKRAGVMLGLVAIPAIYLFSDSYLDRLRTILYITHSQDPTFVTRSNALQNGLTTIQNHFLLGTGWNSPTAFNDWVNVGVAIGAIGLLFFVGWYVHILARLSKRSLTHRSKEYNLSIAFLASLIGNAISMISGAMFHVFPIMTAFWLVFCLACRFTEISQPEKEIAHEHESKIICSTSHLQRRAHGG